MLLLPSLATLSAGIKATVIAGYEGMRLVNKCRPLQYSMEKLIFMRKSLPVKNVDVGRVTSGGGRQLVLQLICHVIVPSSGRAAFKYPQRRTKDQMARIGQF